MPFLIAPLEVSPPAAISNPNSLFVHWDLPFKPNGIITQYILYKDNTVVYQGNRTSFNITGKQDFAAWYPLLEWKVSSQGHIHIDWICDIYSFTKGMFWVHYKRNCINNICAITLNDYHRKKATLC